MAKKKPVKKLPPVIKRNLRSPHIEAHYCETDKKWSLRTRFGDVLSPAYNPLFYIPEDIRRLVTGITDITFPRADEARLSYTTARGIGWFTVIYTPGKGFKGITV